MTNFSGKKFLTASLIFLSVLVVGLFLWRTSVRAISDPYYNTILAESSLVSYYHFDETAGASTSTDAKGNNTLTVSNVTFGQTSLLPSGAGTAALFNGSSSKLTTASSGVFSFNNTQPFSFEFLVKPNVTRSGSDNEYAIISNINPSSPFNGYEVQLMYNNYVASKDVVRLFLINNFGGNNYIDVAGSTDLQNGVIYDVVVTYDGSDSTNGVHIYVNGVADTLNVSKNALTSSILSSSTVTIGARGTSRYLAGTLDELSIYNTALSSPQVVSHCAAFLETPAITSFSASPSIISSGSSSILTWNITNASSVAITPGSFSTSTLVASTTVNPTSTTVYTLTATNADGTSTATTSIETGIIPADPTPPVPVILDTDLASDIDDVGDITVLNELANRGKATIVGVITDSANAYSAPAAAAFLKYFGKSSVPVGAYQGSTPSGGAASSLYTQQITNLFGTPGDTRANYTDATTEYRTLLASAANNSVVIVDTGFFEPLSSLLQSSADGISSSTGMQLVAQKVRRLVIVAGIYPSSNGSAEYNLQQDPVAANYVFSNWPTQIISAGIELGNTVFTGPPVVASSTTNPVQEAFYLASSLLTNGQRQAWGQLGVLYGVYGLSTNFDILGLDGTNNVSSSTGNNTWTATPAGSSSYLGKAISDSALENILNPLLVTQPPVVAMTAPANSSNVSSTITISASSTATSPASIASIQFYLDGSPLGSPVTSTSSPNTYSYSWNTASSTNGTHTLYALATDNYTNSATSTSITVTVANSAILSLATSTSLNFAAAHGSTATSTQSVIVSNVAGSGTTLNWSASSTQTWLTFSPASSSLTGGASTSVAFIVNPTGLAIGTYHATTTISDPNASSSPQTMPASLVINATGISTSLTSPTNGATVTSTISIVATATSTVGISSVQFYLDGSPLGSAVTSSPYNVSWNTKTATNTSHTLYSLVTDNNANTASSSVITVTVDNLPPSISITSPTNGATVSGASVSLVASSTDTQSGVALIQFYLDGSTLIGQSASSPFTTTWDTTQTSNATHALTAIATDGVGNATTSAAISVTVNNASTPPTSGGLVVGVASGYGIPNYETYISYSTSPAATSSSTASIQALVNTLTAQLQTLLAQSGETGGTASTTGAANFIFTRDLQLHDTGNDVRMLQKFLNSKGFLLSQTALGSPNNETTYFGAKTWDALVRFQKSIGIKPASGFFGPITRKYVNNLFN